MDNDARGRTRWTPGKPLIIALCLWVLALAIISVLVVIDPGHRTVTGNLHQATGDWWARNDIYTSHKGMNYLPQAVLVFTPFHWIPDHATADTAWRIFGVGLLVLGLALLARSLDENNWQHPFLWMTLIVIWASLGSLRNAQPNLHFSAMQVLAAAMILRRHWWLAAVCLVSATAIKPLGVAMMGLAVFVYPGCWRPLVVCNLVMLGLPFLLASPEYVISQYALFVENLRDTATVTDHRFADISGIVRTFGGELPTAVSLVIRPLAGVFTLGLWIVAGRRCGEPYRALLLLSLASVYLMLFNPMTEPNSYIILAPAMAAVSMYLSDFDGRRRLGIVSAAMALSIGLLPEPLRHIWPNFSLWWHPTMAALFGALVVYRAFLTSSAERGEIAGGDLRDSRR